jgi:CheY-like chemotaxis protein
VENKTILIVEDNGILAVQLRNMLIELGYNAPEPVATGEEAIAVVTAGRSYLVSPELVLSELTSPDLALSGLILPDLILMDINMADEHTERPNAFIGKPYQLKSLAAVIRRAVYGSDWHG